MGPPHGNSSWQSRLEGGYDPQRFVLDWEAQKAHCPQGRCSCSWTERSSSRGKPRFFVLFKRDECRRCPDRALCTRSKLNGRMLQLPSREEYEDLKAARQRMASEKGQQLYNQRAGIEGTLSQGVRAFGLRKARYRGLAKTRLQHIATAAAVNLDRLVNWLNGDIPENKRISKFAALAA